MTDDERSDAQRDLKTSFLEAVGLWRAAHGEWLRLDEESFRRYERLAAHVWTQDALDERETALVAVALDATVTHLYADGLRASVGHALDAGATPAEVREVLELTCGVGMHSLIEGLPLVTEAFDGPPAGDAADREHVREAFEERRGYWSAFWESVLESDHAFLEKYTDLSASPWERGSLDPKLRELVYVAIDASTTHLYGPGLEAHVENAIGHGATRAELVCVLELASLQGYDTMLAGVPILREEAAKRGLLEE